MVEIDINQVEYSNRTDGAVIHVFGRDKDGTTHRLDVVGFQPYFYVLESQRNIVPPDLKIDNNIYVSIYGEKLIKVFTKKPSDIRDIKDKFINYEGDILFTQRFLIDKKIKSGISFEVSPCTPDDIKPIDVNYPTRVCFVDIEADDSRGFPDSSKDPIFSIGCYDSFEKKYCTFVYSLDIEKSEKLIEEKRKYPDKNGCFSEHHDIYVYNTEKEMLEEFCKYIQFYDFDILTGWNFTEFDAPYILQRLDVLGINRENISRLRGGNSTRVEIRGRQLFDLLTSYKRMHLGEKESFRLDAIALEELGEGKIHHAGKVSDLWKTDILNFILYNYVDVYLCVHIDEKDKTITFHRQISKYVGCSLEKTTNSMPIIDALILRESKEHGFVLPSKAMSINSSESFKGATVIAPTRGLFENIIVLDLKSLYPMAMMTINASPETKDPNGELVAPNGIRFKKQPDGIVRRIQSKFLKERDEMKSNRNKYSIGSPEYEMFDMQQNVLKVIMNSYYGVSGNPTFRLYDKDIASAITSVGRSILEHNKRLVEAEGFKVIYGDTDSNLIKIPVSIGKEGTIFIARDLEKILNDSYPGFAKNTLNADIQYFSIKFEKIYARFFSGGRKKRYAGLLTWKEGKETSIVDVVGFEVKRSDSPKITRESMKTLITMILQGDSYEEIRSTISDVVRKYRKGEYSLDEIGIPGGIGKQLDEYDIPDAQVRAAKYANEYLGTNFGKGSKPKRLYIKSVPAGYPRTDVVCFEYPDQISENFIIDRDVMLKKSLEDPLSRILDALGWSWSEFDPSIKTLSEFGI